MNKSALEFLTNYKTFQDKSPQYNNHLHASRTLKVFQEIQEDQKLRPYNFSKMLISTKANLQKRFDTELPFTHPMNNSLFVSKVYKPKVSNSYMSSSHGLKTVEVYENAPIQHIPHKKIVCTSQKYRRSGSQGSFKLPSVK